MNKKLLVSTLVLVIIIGGYFFSRNLLDKKTIENEPQNINGSEVPQNESAVKQFSDPDLGIEFEYPSSWGEATLSFEDGQVGRKFIITLAQGRLEVGGISSDFSLGRGKVFTDFKGYTAADLKKLEPYETVATNDGSDVIYIENKEIAMQLSARDTAALINASNNEFPGLAFRFIRPDQEEKQEFESMLKSIKLLK